MLFVLIRLNLIIYTILIFIYNFILLGKEYVEINIPLIDQSFTGTGDLFTSLILIWLNLTDNNLKQSMEKTVATIQAVLKRTIKCKYQVKYFITFKVKFI